MENPFFKEFMVGYTIETEVDTVLLHQMQWFMRMHNIVSFTKLLRSVDIPESQNSQEKFNGLRKKLLDKIVDYRVSFGKDSTKLR